MSSSRRNLRVVVVAGVAVIVLAGDGINPGAIGWVTLHLSPGNYELVRNLVGHNSAGMYMQLTVT